MLGHLLQLQASDPHIRNKQIHEFLRHELSRIGRLDDVARPLIVSHIGYLIVEGEYEDARQLLGHVPTPDRTSLGNLVAYLRFLTSSQTEFKGTTDYASLSPQDLFLGACYCGGKDALPALGNHTNWEYTSLENVLTNHELNDFKVRGLQPRIAELAFGHVHGLLYGASAEGQLRDLNLECVQRLAVPWMLESKPILPPADWEDGNGRQYE